MNSRRRWKREEVMIARETATGELGAGARGRHHNETRRDETNSNEFLLYSSLGGDNSLP